MKKKHYVNFLKIFMHLKNVSLIISGDFYEPRVKQEIEEIEKIVNQIDNRDSTLIKDVLDEIEENLYDHPESREIYLTKILNDFVDIAPYLNIAIIKEDGIEFGKRIIKIGNRTYPGSLAVVHKTLIMREAWGNHGWDEVPITIPEKYAILCFRAFWSFWNQLDDLSTRFKLDLLNIQNILHIHGFERFTPFQNKEFNKPGLPEKLICFDSPETIKSLLEELKGYFNGKESELKKALDGERLNELLVFPHNANIFIEVFRRLKYNGKLLNQSTEIRDWICLNFAYRFKKGKIEKFIAFKEHTVYDNLKGKAGTEPAKKQRILQNLAWLPYKSKSQLDGEAEAEKLK
ncbi:MAG: hypothetical protein WCL21_11745 [Mariniphaga sp.]